MPELFSSLKLRGLTLPNRIAVSPMCQYSSTDGFANDWHLVHLGSRAVGGAGLVIMEASAVSAEGRITPGDHGIWKDEHVAKLRQITAFIHSQGSYAGIQLAHAGRKASMRVPWETESVAPLAEGGWANVVAPSAVAFAPHFMLPVELDAAGIQKVVDDYASAALRAVDAGFHVIEIHGAHGYLLHEFLSPLSNFRTDEYGGTFENRIRIFTRVVKAVRANWPEERPLFVRVSSTDWAEGGWDIDQSVRLAAVLKDLGVDLIDASSGGLVPGVKIPIGPGYQVAFAERIRREAGIATAAVGMITEAGQAQEIIQSGQADLVLLAREELRDPYWPMHAAEKLGAAGSWPVQYLRAAPPGSTRR